MGYSVKVEPTQTDSDYRNRLENRDDTGGAFESLPSQPARAA